MMPSPRFAHRSLSLWAFASLLVLSCNRVPEPKPESEDERASATASATATPSSSPVTSDNAPDRSAAPSSSVSTAVVANAPRVRDPEQGDFTIEEALRGLPGAGAPVAHIETDLGKLECELYQDKAPVAVANFVGLARGTRPWKSPKAQWVTEPAYDGTVFHRIIKGFMIQGGDAEGTGKGGPGYVFNDEVWQGARHDRRGLLCMANRGPNTNGAQFFILDGPAPHLDRSYTIFGMCGPDALVEKLAAVPVVGDRPAKPPVIKHVTITRK